MKLLAHLPRVIATLVMLLMAIAAGLHLWNYYMEAPWTRDGRVRSEVTRLATDLSGLVSEVRVQDNQFVKRGELLLTLDRARFVLAVQEAEANLESLRLVMAQKVRDANRANRLNAALAQASREQARADADIATANVHQAEVQLAQARLNLARTQVRAPTNGYVTNLNLHVGDYLNAGNPVLALVNSDAFYVAGYFEETKLKHIRVGDRVRVMLMGADAPLFGRVASIANGIQDRELTSSQDGQLANVNPTFQWVRLAQRIPVRIQLDPLPSQVRLVAGQTASVEIIPASSSQAASAPSASPQNSSVQGTR